MRVIFVIETVFDIDDKGARYDEKVRLCEELKRMGYMVRVFSNGMTAYRFKDD